MEYAKAAAISNERILNLLVKYPAKGIEIISPAGILASIRPRDASFNMNFCCIPGIREVKEANMIPDMK